jgi:CheY-like chemotaxis protein
VSRILVIDDNETVRDVIRQLLEFGGHEVSECEDGPKGLEAQRTNPFDLVIVDIQLPGISGFEVIRCLRDEEKGVRIIAVAGRTEKTLEKAIEAGADRIMTKPLRLRPFLEIVNELLEQ